MPDKLIKTLSTFFYVGYFPAAPGSVASFAGLLGIIVLHDYWGAYIAVTIIVTILGFAVCGKAEKIFNEKDPSRIVIDEVAGSLMAFFMLPLTPSVLITAYFLFRAFDMFKVYPVNKFEEIPGAAGIMCDDIFAGIYTNIVMHLALKWAALIS